ncbi:MAG: hypothetical protein JW741_11420 [Sedimentisphaerales bacterium]|nr:hypothetical protein [Sedimentisphaerales bacterium]
MNIVSLVIAFVSLGLAAVAYWRSGGKRDVEIARARIEDELDRLRAKQKELLEHMSEGVAAAYERSRRRIERIRANLDRLKNETSEGVKKQAELASRQLQELERQLESNAKSAADNTLSAARKAQEALSRRVRRMEARTKLLLAKVQVTLAQGLCAREKLDRAARHLEEASEHLGEARAILGADHAYDSDVTDMRRTLSEAMAAVRSKAEDSKKKVDELLSATERLIGGMEKDEHSEQK